MDSLTSDPQERADDVIREIWNGQMPHLVIVECVLLDVEEGLAVMPEVQVRALRALLAALEIIEFEWEDVRDQD